MTLCKRCNDRRPVDQAGYCQTCARKLAGLCGYTHCDRPHKPRDRYCSGHRHQLERTGTLGPLRGRGAPRDGSPWTRAELLTEVQHLIGTDRPVSIARRLGYTDLEGLYRALHRMADEYPEAAELRARLVAQAQDEADLLRHVSGCWERRVA